MPRRLIQLFAGLVLYGVSDAMLLLAGLGVDPWDVLHQGLSRRTGVPLFRRPDPGQAAPGLQPPSASQADR